MSAFIPFYITLAIFVAWVLVWKAIAVWHAAGRRDKVWFIVLFVLNTAGILELVYLFRITKKPMFLWLMGVSLALFVVFIWQMATLPLPPTIFPLR